MYMTHLLLAYPLPHRLSPACWDRGRIGRHCHLPLQHSQIAAYIPGTYIPQGRCWPLRLWEGGFQLSQGPWGASLRLKYSSICPSQHIPLHKGGGGKIQESVFLFTFIQNGYDYRDWWGEATGRTQAGYQQSLAPGWWRGGLTPNAGPTVLIPLPLTKLEKKI